jgi:hypothetical protein
MAFTDFKSADQVQKAYQIRYEDKSFITFTAKTLPEYFVREFEFNCENFDVFGSEASRCEADRNLGRMSWTSPLFLLLKPNKMISFAVGDSA